MVDSDTHSSKHLGGIESFFKNALVRNQLGKSLVYVYSKTPLSGD